MLRREYSGVFGVIVALFALELIGDLRTGRGLKVDPMWRILLGGLGKTNGAVDMARRNLEEHMGSSVQPIDPTHGAALTDRIQPTPELMATLSPLVGMLLRSRREAVAV